MFSSIYSISRMLLQWSLPVHVQGTDKYLFEFEMIAQMWSMYIRKDRAAARTHYLSSTFHILLIYTTKDHTASPAEI